MGVYFSDVVDKAIEDIYYCYDREKARMAADALLLAAKEGDGDACYLLSRCFSGVCYSWDYHPFEENEAAAYGMLGQAISLGSAAAVLGALRMDMLTPEFREKMPFSTVKEAWEVIYQKAEAGSPFCQYLIGNTYYFLDIIEIEDRKESEFRSRKEWQNWQRETMEKSIPWCEKAFTGGMGLAGRNYYHYYKRGRGDLIPPDPERAKEIIWKGAELGYPDWMNTLAVELCFRQNRWEEGLAWAQKAVKRGELCAWSVIGDAYLDGKGVEKNFSYALECYEKTADYGNDAYASARAGEMYFRGMGTKPDQARAVQYLEQAHRLDEGEGNIDTDILGLCVLLGYGCRPDPGRGKRLLEEASNTVFKRYGLGMMYAEGIGVPEDIEKGVEYLKAAGNYEPAKEALKRYKRNIFGVWRRR